MLGPWMRTRRAAAVHNWAFCWPWVLAMFGGFPSGEGRVVVLERPRCGCAPRLRSRRLLCSSAVFEPHAGSSGA